MNTLRLSLQESGRVISQVFQGIIQVLRPLLRCDLWIYRSQKLTTTIRRYPTKAGIIITLMFGILILMKGIVPGWNAKSHLPWTLVREGEFHVTIIESGTLQALRSVTYSSAIQSNQAKIVAIAPEGKLVQKGDLLLLFDAAPFEEEIRRSQALLSQAEADLQKARQDYKLQGIQNQEDLSSARQKVDRSDLELRDVQEGKGKLKEEEAQAAVGNAERELQKNKGALEDLRPLLAEGFITKVELERAEQVVARAEEDLVLAKRRRDSLLTFGRPLELSQARSEALLTKENLKQLEAASSYRLEQKKATIAAAESRIQEATSKLALARQQLARTEVRADVPGIVVYRDVFFGSEQRKPQVGDQVWANQPLLILPDISKMVVETRVRETDIHKIERNQKVEVKVEAYPNLTLTGAVTLVGTLAQEEKDRRGTKFFGVTIEINESSQKLRPGMTAHVQVLVEKRTAALFIPLEAVFEREGRNICYVSEWGRIQPVDVVLGPSNQNFVVIEKGLRKGGRVFLRDPNVPPSDFGSLEPP